METIQPKIERELVPRPRDISTEFLSMSVSKLLEFLRTLRNEPALSITIDWVDVSTARRLKAFLEDPNAIGKQKRFWHSQGGIWGTAPLLVLDVYEHAYFIDYGSDRKSYIEDFFANLNWKIINKRYLKIVKQKVGKNLTN